MSFTNQLLMVMGRFPGANTLELALQCPIVKVTDRTVRDNLGTEHLEIVTPDGDYLPAILQYPIDLAAKAPAVLCLHQTTRDPSVGKSEPAGLGGNPEFAYGYELAQRGFVTLMPDYPQFGTYHLTEQDIYETLRYESITLKAVVNHITAISYLTHLDQVDPTRIACMGHSLGGSNTLFLACFDDRIKTIVVSCGFSTFAAYAQNHPQKNLQGWSRSDKYMPLIREKFNDDPALMPFDFPELICNLAPMAILINGTKQDDIFPYVGVEETVREVERVYRTLKQSDRFEFHGPEVGHAFPSAIREKAYDFITRFSMTRVDDSQAPLAS